jgi:hypothetical protein
MTTCTNHSPSSVATCPVNGKPYREVGRQTVLHHVRKPWAKDLPEQRYFFCTDSHCDVVYFGEDNSQVLRNELREPVGQKSAHPQRTICYCFDIRLSDIRHNPQPLKQFVIEQTKDSQCDCRIRNPSGKCCLKDFP